MVPVKCGICGHKQHWKCKGGPRLKDLTCGSCGAARFKRDHYAARKQRVLTEAAAEERAAQCPPPLPTDQQMRYATLKALERVAASLEDLVAMGAEAGYGHAMLTGNRRQPDRHAAPAPLRVISSEDPSERVKFNPRKGDRLMFGAGRFMDVVAAGAHALTVRERKGQEIYETAITRDQWQAAADVAESVAAAPEQCNEPAAAAKAGA